MAYSMETHFEPEGVPFDGPVEVCSRSVSEGEDAPESDEAAALAPTVAGKRPRSAVCEQLWHPEGQEEDLCVLPDPDLEEVFSAADTDLHHRIRICRTYANYLAAKLKTKRMK